MKDSKIRRNYLVLFGIILLSVSLACSTLGGSSEAEELQDTKIALSITATALQAAADQPAQTQPPGQPPQETAPPEPEQPVETEPPAPAEPSAPTISASVNTNCREGPSQDYDIQGYLLKNQASTVVGKDESSNWWVIENPDKPGEKCWVWSETTTVTGDTSEIPVVEPPPLPDVEVAVGFSTFTMCGPDPALVFQIDNSSGPDLESVRLTIKDLTEGDTVYGPAQSNSPFLEAPTSCPPGINTLPAGAVGYVAGKVTRLSLPAAMMQAIIQVCTQDSLGGSCGQQTIEFVMPAP
jgi:hypothetical protein